jgi:hypothetical protein
VLTTFSILLLDWNLSLVVFDCTGYGCSSGCSICGQLQDSITVSGLKISEILPALKTLLVTLVFPAGITGHLILLLPKKTVQDDEICSPSASPEIF